MLLKHVEFEIWVEAALYVSLKVLGMEHMYNMIDVEYSHDPNTKFDALWRRTVIGCDSIIINKSIIIPFPISAFYDMNCVLGASEEGKRHMVKFAYIMKICYLVYHEVRHIYQACAADPHHTSIDEPERTRKAWAKAMNSCKNDINNRSLILEKDADDFAFYLSSRFPEDLGIEDIAKFKEYIDKYDRVSIPDESELIEVMKRLDETKNKRKRLSDFFAFAGESFSG